MAAPITHLFFANKFFNRKFSQFDPAKFFVGTCFPDIRYFDNLARSRTHLKDVVFHDLVQEKEAFAAGFKFHSFLDEQRNNFYRHQPGFPFFMEPGRITDTAIKFFEDELIYNSFNDWQLLAGYFDSVFEEESRFEIEKEDIHRWHNLIKNYINRRPDDESRDAFLKGVDFTDDNATQIARFIAEMRQTERVKKAVEDFFDLIDKKIG